MSNRLKKKKIIRLVAILVTLVSLITFTEFTPLIINAITNANQENIDIDNIPEEPNFEVSDFKVEPTTVKIGNNITVSGNIKANPYKQEFEKKEIVLVLDVSNSMKENNKISNLSHAVDIFFEQIKGIPNLRVALVFYSTTVNINPYGDVKIKTVYKNQSPKNVITFSENYKTTFVEENISEDEKYFLSVNDEMEKLKEIKNKAIEAVQNIVIKDNNYCYGQLNIDGGTSTGEALRQAGNLLSLGSSNNSKKSIVFMTDGIPGYYTSTKSKTENYEITSRDKYKELEKKGFYNYIDSKTIDVYENGSSQIKNENTIYLGGNGSVNINKDNEKDKKKAEDNILLSTEYAKAIGNEIAKSNINIYSIGYGLDSEGQKNLKSIHESMNGLDDDQHRFFATNNVGGTDSEDKLGEIFNQIANQITGAYKFSGINIDLNLPDEFSLNQLSDEQASEFNEVIKDGKISLANSIEYTRSSNIYRESNGKLAYLYTASEISFKFTISAKQSGSYNLFGESSKIFLGSKDRYLSLPMKSIAVELPHIEAELNNKERYQNETYTLEDEIPVSYTIKPQNFKWNDKISWEHQYDENAPKDIVFLVDVSKAMNGKLSDAKQAIKNKIIIDDKFKSIKSRYSIITYSDTVSEIKLNENDDEVKKISTSNDESAYANAIDKTILDKLQVSSSDERNISDALNKAQDILESGINESVTNKLDENRGSATKNIVIIGGGNLSDYGTENLNKTINSIKRKNYKVVTLDLGYINSQTKKTDTNLKELQYSLINKLIDSSETLQDEQNNNYFIDVDYQKYDSNPSNDFFNDFNNLNNTNWIEGSIAQRIANKLLEPSSTNNSSHQQQYTFDIKLRFDLNSNFSIVLDLNQLWNNIKGNTAETNQMTVTYTLNSDGEYEAQGQPITFKIKPLKSGELTFGNKNIISYDGLGNIPIENPIDTPVIKVLQSGDIKHGFYDGTKKDGEPEIDEDTSSKVLVSGTDRQLGAVFTAYKDTQAELDIGQLAVTNDVKAYVIDGEGNKGDELDVSGSGTKYNISFSNLTENCMKILIVYTVRVPDEKGTCTSTISYLKKPAYAYINTNGKKDYLPELF